jgi:hypothetical protein
MSSENTATMATVAAAVGVIAAGGAGCHGEVVGKPGSTCLTGPHLG